MSLLAVIFFLCYLPFVYSSRLPRYSCDELPKHQHRIGLSEDVHIDASVVNVGALTFPNVTLLNSYSACRIIGKIAYGAEKNNTLNFEVWLPESSDYNGRYMSVGRFIVW